MTYEEFKKLAQPLQDAIDRGDLVWECDKSMHDYIMSPDYLKFTAEDQKKLDDMVDEMNFEASWGTYGL
jgi:hypothetical protein